MTSLAVNSETTMTSSDDLVGGVSVLPRQGRIVAADFGARALGMREEVQIVDGDDLGGAARGQEKRVHRV
jgi:hypothetical protein